MKSPGLYITDLKEQRETLRTLVLDSFGRRHLRQWCQQYSHEPRVSEARMIRWLRLQPDAGGWAVDQGWPAVRRQAEGGAL